MNEFSKSKELWDYEDFLADVLGVWDCYEQRWCEDAPLVLRFEERDIWVIRTDPEGLLVSSGAANVVSGDCVTNGDPACLVSGDRPTVPSAAKCLCWRSISELWRFGGTEMTVRDAAEAAQKVIY